MSGILIPLLADPVLEILQTDLTLFSNEVLPFRALMTNVVR